MTSVRAGTTLVAAIKKQFEIKLQASQEGLFDLSQVVDEIGNFFLVYGKDLATDQKAELRAGAIYHLGKKIISETKYDGLNAVNILGRMETFFIKYGKDLSTEQFKELQDDYKKIDNKFSHDVMRVSRKITLDLADLIKITEKKVTENVTKKKAELDNPQACLNFTNNLALIVAEDLLSKESIDERTAAMDRWLGFARKSFNLGDYQTTNAIITGFGFSFISRLKGTFAGLPPEAKKIFDEINELMEKQAALIQYRSKPIIPRFVYYTGHFTKLLDRINGFEDAKAQEQAQEQPDETKISNIQKQIDVLGTTLQGYVQEFQTIQQELTEASKGKTVDDGLYQELTKNVVLDKTKENTLYALSTKHEPRGVLTKESHVFSGQLSKLSLNHDKKILLNKKCRAFLELNQTQKSIENHNAEIKGVLRGLEDYLTSKRWDLQKSRRIKKVWDQLADLKDHVYDCVGRGSIPNIEQMIKVVDLAINDPKNNQHSIFSKEKIKSETGNPVDSTLVIKLKKLHAELMHAQQLKAKLASCEEELKKFDGKKIKVHNKSPHQHAKKKIQDPKTELSLEKKHKKIEQKDKLAAKVLMTMPHEESVASLKAEEAKIATVVALTEERVPDKVVVQEESPVNNERLRRSSSTSMLMDIMPQTHQDEPPHQDEPQEIRVPDKSARARRRSANIEKLVQLFESSGEPTESTTLNQGEDEGLRQKSDRVSLANVRSLISIFEPIKPEKAREVTTEEPEMTSTIGRRRMRRSPTNNEIL